jgi:hypothetical protein
MQAAKAISITRSTLSTPSVSQTISHRHYRPDYSDVAAFGDQPAERLDLTIEGTNGSGGGALANGTVLGQQPASSMAAGLLAAPSSQPTVSR